MSGLMVRMECLNHGRKYFLFLENRVSFLGIAMVHAVDVEVLFVLLGNGNHARMATPSLGHAFFMVRELLSLMTTLGLSRLGQIALRSIYV